MFGKIMRRFITNLFVACILSSVAHAQGYNPGYGAVVEVSFRAQNGRIPGYITIAPPSYPFEMYRAGLTGHVGFELTVQDNGGVTDIVLTKISNEGFKASALEAIRTWRFLALKNNPGGSPRPLKIVGKLIWSIDDR